MKAIAWRSRRTICKAASASWPSWQRNRATSPSTIFNDVLPEGVTDADEFDAILTQLRKMEIDIIEASEVDRYKEGKKETEEEEEEEEKPETRLRFSMIRCGCISSRWARFLC